ncbi:DUF3219 domain-containing protein [Bacillus sp. FJAT-27225]|uniref:DUF3219 family protein n=1 Tax=Bacillus sp. FJAT-27225 TaxID=1743144 RepID=UPI00080C2850|nr:DUF3219 family protein [Bacillus sp. FJAT-27225]OCA91493.1 DUF3219 domain-containing protein [Bacillus sp. FJAT-27225]
MIKEIVLNETVIQVDKYKEEIKNGLHNIIIDFNVTNEQYHDIATLLYEATFDVKVPERGLAFRGTIQEYSTSITNLYERGQVGQYHLVLKELRPRKGS